MGSVGQYCASTERFSLSKRSMKHSPEALELFSHACFIFSTRDYVQGGTQTNLRVCLLCIISEMQGIMWGEPELCAWCN